MRRLAIALAAAGTLALAATASATVPNADRFHVCANDAPFSIAIYVKGMTCDTGLLVISTWVSHRCHHTASCSFTYRSHDHKVSFHLGCSNGHHTDHRGREYVYMACFSDDRVHDIRSRFYPRGDYRPDR